MVYFGSFAFLGHYLVDCFQSHCLTFIESFPIEVYICICYIILDLIYVLQVFFVSGIVLLIVFFFLKLYM